MNKYVFVRILSLIISASLLAGCAKSPLPSLNASPFGSRS